jgi:hypothetical protein
VGFGRIRDLATGLADKKRRGPKPPLKNVGTLIPTPPLTLKTVRQRSEKSFNINRMPIFPQAVNDGFSTLLIDADEPYGIQDAAF